MERRFKSNEPSWYQRRADGRPLNQNDAADPVTVDRTQLKAGRKSNVQPAGKNSIESHDATIPIVWHRLFAHGRKECSPFETTWTG
jgi:hypothetical protein